MVRPIWVLPKSQVEEGTQATDFGIGAVATNWLVAFAEDAFMIYNKLVICSALNLEVVGCSNLVN